MITKIPTFEEAKEALDRGEASFLDQFIHDYSLADEDKNRRFCNRLRQVIMTVEHETKRQVNIEREYMDRYENENLQMLNSNDDLLDFLFDRSSYIQTDNDNH